MERNNLSENIIAAKLRSERGASITFALLLFLVCAALSAVILVAATTASGRMAGIAETDQRYYSVTSAAEMFSEYIESGTVSAIKYTDEDGHADPTYTYSVHSVAEIAEPENDKDEAENSKDSVAEQAVADIRTKPKNASLDLSEAGDMCIFLAKMLMGDEAQTASWTISSTSTGTDPLAANVEGEIRNADGSAGLAPSLLLTIKSTDTDPYSLQLVFTADIRKVKPPVDEIDGKTIGDAREIKWHVMSIHTPYDAD